MTTIEHEPGLRHLVATPGALAAELERLRTGRSRRRYTPRGEIARGGMGLVLHMWDEVLRRPVAMKVLEADAGEKDAGAAQRFLAEAQIAGALQHPAIVPIHDLGVDEDGRLYFTMPLIEGRDLGAVFDLALARREGWTLVRAVQALTAVCDVIAYAHSRGVIHRDLKPANVLVGTYGAIHVLDWGLAQLVDPLPAARGDGDGSGAGACDGGSVSVGSVSGTPPWMAPEQAEACGTQVSFRTDVYALGALLHRLLAGRPPYVSRHAAADPDKLLALIRRGPPTPLTRLAPRAPQALIASATRAMQRRPEDRQARVEEFADELQTFLEGTGGHREGFRLALDGMAGRFRARVLSVVRRGGSGA
jgi:serine/threonine protein kinase